MAIFRVTARVSTSRCLSRSSSSAARQHRTTDHPGAELAHGGSIAIRLPQ
jgi:hypothetical protein